MSTASDYSVEDVSLLRWTIEQLRADLKAAQAERARWYRQAMEAEDEHNRLRAQIIDLDDRGDLNHKAKWERLLDGIRVVSDDH